MENPEIPSQDPAPLSSENVSADQAPTVLAHASIPSQPVQGEADPSQPQPEPILSISAEPQGETNPMSDSIPPVPDGSIPPAPFEPVSEAVPPAPPEPPMTPEIVDANPPKKSNRTIWIIVIVIVVLLLCCCCLGGGGLLAFPSIFGRNLLGWIDLNAYLPLLAGLA